MSTAGSSLFQAMTCPQFGDKPLPRPMKACSQLVGIFFSSGSKLLQQFVHSVSDGANALTLAAKQHNIVPNAAGQGRSNPVLTTDIISHIHGWVLWNNHITTYPRYIAAESNTILDKNERKKSKTLFLL